MICLRGGTHYITEVVSSMRPKVASPSLARSSVMSEPTGLPQTEDEKPPIWQIALVAVVLAALIAAATLAVVQIYPHQLPSTKNPSFVDNIFDSRVVILVVRVALMFAAGYIVISVVGLIVGRRWLAELGPFKASEPIAQLDRSTKTLETDLANALEMVDGLEERLLESDDAIAQAHSDIATLLDHIDTMETEKEARDGA
jgi:hypothetical protein